MAIFQLHKNTEKIGLSIAALFLVISSGFTLAMYRNYRASLVPVTETVLGAKTEISATAAASNSCLPQEKITEALKIGERTVTLYVPDKSLVVPLAPYSSCFVSTGCQSSSNVACKDVKLSLDVACLTKQIQEYPLALTKEYVLSRNDLSIKVRKEDWTVNPAEIAAQIADSVAKEISFCQLTGEEKLPKRNIGNIQIAVSDELPSTDGTFARSYIEIDRSKQLLYFWNDGIYQPYYLVKGARIPSTQLTLRKDIALEKMLQSIDAGYILRNSKNSDYVVVHE